MRRRSPTPTPWSLAQASSTTAPAGPSRDSVLGEPVSQSRDSTRLTVRGSTPDTRTSSPAIFPPAVDSEDTVLTPARARRRRRARDLREAVHVLDHEVALEVPVDRPRDRSLDPGGEDGDEDHEREADHQRRRGHGRARRLAQRVLARQPPGEPAQALDRPARDRGERPHEPRAHERDAEQHRNRPASHQAGGGARVVDAAEEADAGDRDPDHAEQDRERGVEAAARGRPPGARPRAAPPSASPAWPAAPATARMRASRRGRRAGTPRSSASPRPCPCWAGRRRSP